MKCLYIIEQLIRSPLKQCHVIILQKLIASILHKATFKLHDICTNRSGDNKHMIIAEKMSCNMLKSAAKYGFVSDLVYIAMYYNKARKYMEAVSVVEMIKVNLAQPGLMDSQV